MIRIAIARVFFGLLTLGLALVFGQKGQVLDGVTSSPIAKATVMHKPSWAMVVTDAEGRFDFTGKVTRLGFSRPVHSFHPQSGSLAAVGHWVSPLGITQRIVQAGQDPLDFKPPVDGLYFLRLNGHTHRFFHLRNQWIGAFSNSQSHVSAQSLRRVSATEEAIIISRFGYHPISLAAVEGELGPIRLTPAADAAPPGMRKLSGGTFIQRSTDGTPVLSVTVGGFFIDTTEITQEDYALVTGQRPWVLRSETYRQWFEINYKASVGTRYPAILLTWDEAALYCNLRSKRDGLDTAFTYQSIYYEYRPNHPKLKDFAVNIEANGYRLPTAAEWEYACRGGQDSAYFWGLNRGDADSSGKYAWYDVNAPKYMYAHGPSKDSITQAPVALKPPNPFGLYDMAGNVREHIADMGYPQNAGNAVTNPFHLASDNQGNYWPEQMGGSFLSSEDYIKCSSRGSGGWRDSSIIDYGFRAVLPIRP